MRILINFFVIIILALFPKFIFGQGCSDAGICAVGSLNTVEFKFEKLPFESNKLEMISLEDQGETDTILSSKLKVATPDQNPEVINAGKIQSVYSTYQIKSSKFFMQYSIQYALSDQGPTIINNLIEGNVNLLRDQLFIHIKVPYSSISGDLGSINGLSDLTLSASYIAFKNIKSNLGFTLGYKFPANKSDRSLNNEPLPMVYQTSLGSHDLLLGFRYLFNKLDFTLGYQHSFNSNENNYSYALSTNDNYFESSKIKRSDDVIFRILRNFREKKFNFNAGLLFIYHLNNDKITNRYGQRIEVKGSKGLTINLNLAAIIPISKRFDFTFNFGNPLKLREARPDGLGRKLVTTAGIKYNFF